MARWLTRLLDLLCCPKDQGPAGAGGLSTHFEVEELTGIRNIPARSLAGAVNKVGWRHGGDKLLGLMDQKGYKVDHYLERTAVAGMVGFFWLARAVKRSPT